MQEFFETNAPNDYFSRPKDQGLQIFRFQEDATNKDGNIITDLTVTEICSPECSESFKNIDLR